MAGGARRGRPKASDWITLGVGGRWNRKTRRYRFKHYIAGTRGKHARTEDGTAATLPLATAAYQKFAAKFAPGGEENQVQTFKEFVASGWEDALDLAGVKDGTRDFYGFALKTVVPLVGHIRLDKFTAATVEGVALKVARAGHSSTTARSYAQVVLRVLRAAVKREAIREFPIRRGVELPKANKPQAELTPEEEMKVLAILRDLPGDRGRAIEALIVVALSTGIRKSDLFGLTWRAVSLEAGTITFTQVKTGETCVVPISPRCRAALLWCKGRGIRSRQGLVLLDWRGLPWTKTVVKDAWDSVQKMAGIPRRRFHDLRHTYASTLVSEGLALGDVGRVLGHTDPKSTARYARVRATDAAERVRAVQEKREQRVG